MADFSVGDKIIGNFNGDGDWFKGTITKVNGNGTYDVDYVDGDQESGMTGDNIKADADEATNGGGGGNGGGDATPKKDAGIGQDRKASNSDFSADSVRARKTRREKEAAAYKAQTQRDEYAFSLFGTKYDTTKYHQVCLWENSWYDWSIFIISFIMLYGITSLLFTIGFKAMERCEFAHSHSEDDLGPANINDIPVHSRYNVNFYTYTAMMFIAFTVIGLTVYRHDVEAARQKGIQEEKEAQAAIELQEMGGPSRI